MNGTDGRRAAAGVTALALCILGAPAALAQVGGPLPVVPAQPGAPPLVADDPARVFGNDADFNPLAIIGILGLKASAQLVTEYSDNIRRISDDVRPEGLVSKADWRFSPTLTLNAGRNVGRQNLFVVGVLGRDFYARNDILNRTRAVVNGGLLWSLGARCSGRVQGGWSTRGTRFDQFGVVLPSSQETTRFDANGGCRTATGLGFNLGYDWNQVTNDLDFRQTADSRAQGVNGGVTYALGQRGDVGISAFWRESELINQPLLPDGQRNGVEISGITGTVNYRLSPSLRSTVSLGYSNAETRSALTPGFSGLTWTALLNYSGPRIGATISGGRSVSGGAGNFATYQLGTDFLASIRYRTPSRISLNAGFAHSNTQNRGASEFPSLGRLDRYRLNRWTAGADYTVNRIFSVGADVNHQNRSAEPDRFDYRATSLILTLRASI